MIKIEILDGKVNPSNVSIEPGERIKWINHSKSEHIIVADDDTFSTDKLSPGEEFEEAIDEKGLHAYHCGLHPNELLGEIDVAPKASFD